MFIAALFTIAKLWKQPRCPTTDEWIKKMWFIHNGILLSHEEVRNLIICRSMDVTGEHHSERGQPGSEDQKLYVLPHMQNLDLGQIQQCGCLDHVTRGEHIWEIWE
jgi:hypothetical protein